MPPRKNRSSCSPPCPFLLFLSLQRRPDHMTCPRPAIGCLNHVTCCHGPIVEWNRWEADADQDGDVTGTQGFRCNLKQVLTTVFVRHQVCDVIRLWNGLITSIDNCFCPHSCSKDLLSTSTLSLIRPSYPSSVTLISNFPPQNLSIITYFLAVFSAVCNHLRFSVSCLASYTVVGEQPYKSRDMVDSGLGRLLVNTIELTMHTSCYLGLGLTEKINCHRQNQIHNTVLCPRIVYIIEGHSCSSRRLYTLLHCSESSLRSQVQTE